MPTYTISALYCPDGRRHQWHTSGPDAHRTAGLLKAALGLAREKGQRMSDWVDVLVVEEGKASGDQK